MTVDASQVEIIAASRAGGARVAIEAIVGALVDATPGQLTELGCAVLGLEGEVSVLRVLAQLLGADAHVPRRALVAEVVATVLSPRGSR